VLESHYLLQIACSTPECHAEVERQFILPNFDIAFPRGSRTSTTIATFRGWRCGRRTCTATSSASSRRCWRPSRARPAWQGLAPRALEDEFVWRNSYQLNETFYASLGEKRAFVLSHGRDLLVFKMVGYAEQNVEYYQLQDFKAHVWIAHQRYPTKGRVWHPGGAHPFVGLNEALVHNGDFANYHSVCEYLRQRNIRQQFLTDTEVSVQLFDLWDRVYQYPLEYIIEALAPTTELDFDQLPPEKQSHLPADPGHPHSRLAGWPVVLHHRAQPATRTSSSCWASPTRPCCGRRCSRSPTAARCRSA
jgi:hypothetical protein